MNTINPLPLPVVTKRDAQAEATPAPRKPHTNKVKSTVISLAVFAATLVAGDRWLGAILENAYFRIDSGEDGNTTATLVHSTADIEIFGDSRGSHHYDPLIIEKALGDGTTCHNASRAAQSILYIDAAQAALLDRHRPKLIVLELNPTCILASSEARQRLAALRPYYHKVPAIRPVVASHTDHEQLKLLSRSFPFNSKIPALLKGIVRENDSHRKGFQPLHANADARALMASNEISDSDELSKLVDPALIAALKRFVQRANENRVPVVLICSPMYRHTFEPRALELALQQLVDLEFEYWDHINEPEFFGKSEKFHDRNHLNAIGATEYSQLIAEHLSSYLRQDSNMEQ